MSMDSFTSLSLYLAGSQWHHLFSALLNKSFRGQGSAFTYLVTHSIFLLGTSYLSGTILGAEDTKMNKADNGPAFMDWRVGSRYSEGSKKAWGRHIGPEIWFKWKDALGLSGERAFQAKDWGRAKVLKCLHSSRKQVNEWGRRRKVGKTGSRDPGHIRTCREWPALWLLCLQCGGKPASLHSFPSSNPAPTTSSDPVSFLGIYHLYFYLPLSLYSMDFYSSLVYESYFPNYNSRARILSYSPLHSQRLAPRWCSINLSERWWWWYNPSESFPAVRSMIPLNSFNQLVCIMTQRTEIFLDILRLQSCHF